MSFEDDPQTNPPVSPVTPSMSLEKAIELGEYDPDNLIIYPEWHTLSKHLQWTYISKGIDNRRKLLRVHWARVANSPNYSQKPQLQQALRGIEKQLDELQMDEEKLSIEYLS